MPFVLIADDELNIRRMVGALLTAEGYEVTETPSGVEAVARVKETEPDVALIDLMMPGDLDGMATLGKLREVAPDLPVIMMSGRAGLADAVQATKLGAFNFLEKPLTPEGVLLAVSSALELRQTRRVARALRAELGFAGQMVGRSAAMNAVRQMIARVAPTDARVLITGESGTGKELVASAIHDASSRRDKPFVRVNCAAIPRDLVESEMFGHERGAFTGATQTRIGRFELAHHGTLFLDEVGDLGPDAQAKLLRAIEAKEIQRVGGNRVIRTDVRIISATNHDLQRAVKAGTFREDLFFRLQVIPLAIPPLRERGDDILELVEHFSEQFLQRSGQAKPRWRSDALQLLRDYPWPGNVRELANIVERLAILHPGAEITGPHVEDVLIVDREEEEPAVITPTRAQARVPVGNESAQGPVSLAEKMDSFERTVIARALAEAGGNVADAARRLQTDRPNLYRRMKRLGILRVVVGMLAASTLAPPAFAQNADTAATDTLPEHYGWWARTSRSSGLILSSGKTYNRVEGLPVLFGPVFHDSAGAAQINASVLGIIRSANTFHWDSQNLGHRATLDVRVGRGRGYAVGLSSYDVMVPVEPWQLPDPDAGLAAFFGHRDFRDYYNRHGAMATASFNMSARSSLSFDFSDERWASPDERRVFSVFGNGKSWRANPLFDAGRFHTAVLRANVDTRNDEDNPSTGWLILAEYERGLGDITDFGLTSPIARVPTIPRVEYGRGLLDLRRYNRLSQTTWINARLVLGGWLNGDELPLQRRFSIGGVGTVPGFDFRKYEPGTVDVSECSDGITLPAGNPAQCERVALAQLEYRQELHSSLFDFLNARPIRLRGIGFTVQPTLVAFVDAGRGWLVGQPSGTLVYSSRSFPRFGTFRTDVGLGLDLGIIGVYVAKAVSSSKEPANVFLRVHRRF